MSYSFGDSERASRRLALLARVFAPASRPFLAETGRHGGALAVDLGCGPGHTTHLVSRVLGSARTVGLDASAAFLDEARRSASERVAFARHDVLATPYPTGLADTLYARFLLLHLEKPDHALRVFGSQLAPGGRLLLDEVEWIRSEAEVFRRYLALVETVLAAQEQRLCAGPGLAAQAASCPHLVRCELREHAVDPRDAAGLFALNWQTLRARAATLGGVSPAECQALAESLAAIAAGAAEAAPITWGLRQVAIGA